MTDTMKLKDHIRGDGNGGLFISKPFAAFTIAIMLMTMLGQAVLSYSQLDGRLDMLEEKTADSKEVWSRLHECDTNQALLNEKIDMLVTNSQDIKVEIHEIKGDIKTLMLDK